MARIIRSARQHKGVNEVFMEMIQAIRLWHLTLGNIQEFRV